MTRSFCISSQLIRITTSVQQSCALHQAKQSIIPELPSRSIRCWMFGFSSVLRPLQPGTYRSPLRVHVYKTTSTQTKTLLCTTREGTRDRQQLEENLFVNIEFHLVVDVNCHRATRPSFSRFQWCIFLFATNWWHASFLHTAVGTVRIWVNSWFFRQGQGSRASRLKTRQVCAVALFSALLVDFGATMLWLFWIEVARCRVWQKVLVGTKLSSGVVLCV